MLSLCLLLKPEQTIDQHSPLLSANYQPIIKPIIPPSEEPATHQSDQYDTVSFDPSSTPSTPGTLPTTPLAEPISFPQAFQLLLTLHYPDIPFEEALVEYLHFQLQPDASALSADRLES